MGRKRAGEKSIQARHDKRRQKRIREQKIRRYTFFSVLALIAVLCIMFFTPLFNIRAVNVVGNQKLTAEEVVAETGTLEGRNLFTARKRVIKKNLKEMAYIDKVSVKKKPFPPTVIIEITECIPAVQIEYSESFAVIDENGKVLERTTEKLENVPCAVIPSVVSANTGEMIEFKDGETQKNIMSCIGYMKKADIIKDITVASFEDMTNITFNYQARLDVICGTHIDFQRKLALFKEAVNSNKLTQNSRGTINLSTTGKAIYTP